MRIETRFNIGDKVKIKSGDIVEITKINIVVCLHKDREQNIDVEYSVKSDTLPYFLPVQRQDELTETEK